MRVENDQTADEKHWQDKNGNEEVYRRRYSCGERRRQRRYRIGRIVVWKRWWYHKSRVIIRSKR